MKIIGHKDLFPGFEFEFEFEFKYKDDIPSYNHKDHGSIIYEKDNVEYTIYIREEIQNELTESRLGFIFPMCMEYTFDIYVYSHSNRRKRRLEICMSPEYRLPSVDIKNIYIKGNTDLIGIEDIKNIYRKMKISKIL